MNVLLLKMSSLGDIVHTLPAVADAGRQGVRFDWVVEENCRTVPARARGVEQVIEVAFRRWRTAPFAFAPELAAFRRRRPRRRDAVVGGAPGVWKSARGGGLGRAG
ncbi:MAG: hypothetical protein F4Z28_15070 [Gammaproteobacteria bacterium]|nr:hypothetical protein [Gammaproteobacteria bacterium]